MDEFTDIASFQWQGNAYNYFNLAAWWQRFPQLEQLPYSLKILLENVLRNNSGRREQLARAFAQREQIELEFYPSRVLMQDFTGVPAMVDLAAMRDAIQQRGGRATQINPIIPVDLVIDHSLTVDNCSTPQASSENMKLEYQRNTERYQFLKWSQQAFDNFRVVPPGVGICHQINLEYLAQVVWQKKHTGKPTWLYPDSLVGSDSHTTMVNALGVLGWGVGGIEAEAAMLGQHLSMLMPKVVGVNLDGHLPEGSTATDLVLAVTNMLRQYGVVGKFVEFYGTALTQLSLSDMATISNMAPEYGATCGFFPVCQQTIDYLCLSGRSEEQVAIVEQYCQRQGLLWRPENPIPSFDDTLYLNLATVKAAVAGPRRPQDRLLLAEVPPAMAKELAKHQGESPVQVAGEDYQLQHADVVLAAITSCTNTSNPSVMIAAALLAKKACQLGLRSRPWVKSSLAPGSQVVSDYLLKADLQRYLDQLGFNLVGYGCTSCIGNSGSLREEISQAIHLGDLTVAAVISGNRNFEGRVHPEIKLNLLASPPLVLAYALAGTSNIDFEKQAIGQGHGGREVFLADIWPSNQEINATIQSCLSREMFVDRYQKVFDGDPSWQQIKVSDDSTYSWDDHSTYIQNPPYFLATKQRCLSGKPARILALLGDSVTTDHISPAGNISANSPAATYLRQHQVAEVDFNSYGSRRGNHQVMMRGTFANIRLKNELAQGKEGGYTSYLPSGELTSIYDAAISYQRDGIASVVIAGKDYGCGSSRDWAAKGPALLGVVAVLAESFERIHRSNLVGMAVLPLQFLAGQSRKSLKLTGNELITLPDLNDLKPQQKLNLILERPDGQREKLEVCCRIDTADEVAYYQDGGILAHLLEQLSTKTNTANLGCTS